MASSIERAVIRFQDSRLSIAKWTAVLAIAWSAVTLVLCFYSPASILLAVKLSMPPCMIAGLAWGMARTVRAPEARTEARKMGRLAMGALWFCLIVVFVSQMQYRGAVASGDIKIATPSSQTEQNCLDGVWSVGSRYVHMKGW